MSGFPEFGPLRKMLFPSSIIPSGLVNAASATCPIHEMAATMPKLIGLAVRLFGKSFLREYPFEEAYFLAYARQFRAALGMPLVHYDITGDGVYSWADYWLRDW